jgi:hypothetical protein
MKMTLESFRTIVRVIEENIEYEDSYSDWAIGLIYDRLNKNKMINYEVDDWAGCFRSFNEIFEHEVFVHEELTDHEFEWIEAIEFKNPINGIEVVGSRPGYKLIVR